MIDKENWIDIGSADELARVPLKSCKAGSIAVAISFRDGQFGAVSNVCNHVGGPLGEGRLDGDYITCPWHGWKFHCRSGIGEPGYEQDRVPAFPVKVEQKSHAVSAHALMSAGDADSKYRASAAARAITRRGAN